MKVLDILRNLRHDINFKNQNRKNQFEGMPQVSKDVLTLLLFLLFSTTNGVDGEMMDGVTVNFNSEKNFT